MGRKGGGRKGGRKEGGKVGKELVEITFERQERRSYVGVNK